MTYMLYKPAGYVCACTDRENPTVMEFFPPDAHLFPIGRLDKYTEGLLLVTDDGRLNHDLLDPARAIEKCYRLWAVGTADEAMSRAIETGLFLKGLPEPTKPARLVLCGTGQLGNLTVFPIRRPLQAEAPQTPVLEALLYLTEGKRHQVKRMLEATGHLVVALRRETFAGLPLDVTLRPGQHRPLTGEELAALHTLAGR